MAARKGRGLRSRGYRPLPTACSCARGQSICKAPITSVLVDLLVYYLGLITECLKLVREPFSLGLVHRPVLCFTYLQYQSSP
jgi:hypothetical protein